jgi:alpha-1,6-mannosyltransferase
MRGLSGTPTNRIRAASLATLALFVVVMAAQVAINRDAVISVTQPASTDTVAVELLVYYLGSALLLVPYVGVVLFALTHPVDRRALRLLIGTPVVVLLGLLVVPPTFSIDTYSYIAHGVTGTLVGGGDPYSVQPSQVLFLPIGQALHELGWIPPPAPSPYGPIWSIIEVLVTRLPLAIAGQVFLFKAIAAVATLASAAMIWRILGRIRPGQQLAGTLLFLWNPVVLIELAGDGHNDALMIFFVLVAIDAILRSQASRALVATMLGVLVKYLPLIFAPPMAVYELRRNGHDALVRRFAAGAAISAVVAVLAFLPFWSGQTFAAVLRSGGGGPWPLWPTIGGVVQAILAGGIIDSTAAALKTATLGLLFIAYVARQSWHVRDDDSLIRALANIAFVYMFAISAIFYPWYAILPIALFALTETRSALLLVLTMTIGARLDGPPAAYLFPQDMPTPDTWPILTLAVILLTLMVFLFRDRDTVRWLMEGRPRGRRLERLREHLPDAA